MMESIREVWHELMPINEHAIHQQINENHKEIMSILVHKLNKNDEELKVSELLE
jgi:hypothetical protein